MKTTVNISDATLLEAKKLAARQGLTLRALIEKAIREIIAKEAGSTQFKLRRVSFKGRGLQPEFRAGQWAAIRDAAYKGRGG
jgi:hypothetical protein